jgi:hypothetical protein
MYLQEKEVTMIVRLLPLLAVLAAAALAPSAAADRVAGSSACTLAALGPFFYAGDVIPEASVRCDAVQRRLHIEAVLTRDGVQVASASRNCRNAGTCIVSVDASAPDLPGNQQWCVQAAGSVGSVDLGAAKACESEEI